MDPTQRQTVGRMILGSGMAGNAADSMNLQPIWKRAVIDGETDLPFADWMKQYQMQNGGGTVGGMMENAPVQLHKVRTSY